MKTKWMARIGTLLLLVGSLGLSAYAQHPMGGPGFGGPGHGPMGMLRDLNLTDAQQAQVKSIMDANKATMKGLMQQMEQNRAALLQATANGAYDPAKIQALANQQAQISAAMTVQHEALQHQIYTQVLTTEQRAKADQMRTDEINRISQHLQKMQSGAEPPAPPAD